MLRPKNHILLYLTLLFFLVQNTGHSQQRYIDSLVKVFGTLKWDSNRVITLNDIAREYGKSEPDTAIQISERALELAKQINYYRGTGESYYLIGKFYSRKAEFVKSLDFYNRSIDIWEEMDVKTNASDSTIMNLKSSALGNIAGLYLEVGDYPKALDNYFKALRMCEKVKLKWNIASILGNIGSIYLNQKEYEKALQYFLNALKIKEELGNKKGIASTLGNIGIVYDEQGNYSKALEYYFKAIKLEESVGNKVGVARHYGNIGNVYDDQGQYEKALEYYFMSLKMDREAKNKKGICIKTGNIGNTYLHLKDYVHAESYLLKAMQLLDSIGLLIYSKDNFEMLSRLYEEKGQYEKAYKYYLKFISARDSVFNEDNTKKTVRAQMNYDFEKKEQVAKLEQDKKDAIAKEEKQKQSLIRNSFIAGFIFVILLAAFIFKGYRNKQKANKVITLQKEEVEKAKLAIENQKQMVEEKQKEILDSIRYARRIQNALITSEKYFEKHLGKFNNKSV